MIDPDEGLLHMDGNAETRSLNVIFLGRGPAILRGFRKGVCAALLVGLAGCSPAASRCANLFEATESGDLAEIKWHVRHGENVNASDAEEWTALMMAAYRGDARSIKYLLEQGANVNARNSKGASALMIALYGGHHKAAAVLLDRGADVNARTSCGTTPLMIAVRRGNAVIVEEVLRHGEDVDAVDDQGATALSEWESLKRSKGWCNPDIRECLMRHGAAEVVGIAEESQGEAPQDRMCAMPRPM